MRPCFHFNKCVYCNCCQLIDRFFDGRFGQLERSSWQQPERPFEFRKALSSKGGQVKFLRSEGPEYIEGFLNNGFSKFNQILFLFSTPTFNLNFTPSCFDESGENFRINQLKTFIPFRKFSTITSFMPIYSLIQIICCSNIEMISGTTENVGDIHKKYR